ncbi:MAG: hypothetical protein HFJ41_06655 [Clostridia bacterium]|nr:hypothetical protein [Clostridia bacterium]
MKGKCVLYLDDLQPLYVENSLIIQTPDRITFVNINDGTIISKKGSINQVYEYKYFVIHDTNDLYGVIRYDGVVIVPFEFFRILIGDNIIEVQKDKNSDYEQYCKIPK